jgi:class 3 adenylate cyclase
LGNWQGLMTQTGTHVDTRSVLFTDLVASTELRVRLGEDAAESIRRVHDALVADAVIAHGGTVVKGLGDGALTTFGSAADAVAAAVGIQQAVELHGRRAPESAFSVRVGVSVGDVTIETDDVFGVPVIEASRLCGAAAGGEILTADLVRALSRGRGGFVFEPMGSLELKGLREAVPACRIVWEPLTGGAEGGRPAELPGALVGWGATGYIGRADLLDRLEEHWRAVAAGGCRTILLAGEPGVGKTRTAAELARCAHAQGALVLYGRCEEALGVPYQPFVEALDWYTTKSASPELGRLGGELTRVIPDLGARVPGLPRPVASDPRSEEHRLFEAVASWLVQASEAGGLVLVLDDLHWATKPTLLLLLHALRAAADAGTTARLLVVGTYRDTDVDRSHPLSGVLANLRRLPGVKRLAVNSLTAEEVLALVEAAAGLGLDEDGRRLAALVHEETEGNPFFVGEVLRHLVETGMVRREADRWIVADLRELEVPEGVRDVVGRRLSQLSPVANEVLAVGAAIGRSIPLDVLAAVSPTGEDDVVDALDEAVRARLLEETGAEEYRFAHALVRSTLYDELSVTRRRRLHRRVVDAIEKLHPDDVVALAYHSVEAGPDGGDVTRAVTYVLAAAEQAQAARAWAEAEARFRVALELLADAEVSDAAQEIAALCGLGECQRGQSEPDYRTTLLDAARRAAAAGEVDLLVRAVLANTRGMTSVVNTVDEDRVELIEVALEAVGAEPSADRARLLAHLATEVIFTGDHDRCLALVEEAESLARGLDDRGVLGWVLVHTGFAAIADARWREMVARTAEAVELADEAGDPAQQVIARWFWASALLTAGDIPAFEQVIADMVTIAEAGSPTLRWMAGAKTVPLLVWRGRFDEATQRNDEVLALGLDAGEADAAQWAGALASNMAWIRGEKGWADIVGSFADQYPLGQTWRAGHAFYLADDERLDEARAVLDRYELDVSVVRREPFPFEAAFLMAHIAHDLADRHLAERVAAEFTDHVDCWTHFHTGGNGPVTRDLGICALTVGEADRAVALLEDAIEKVTCHGYDGLLPRMRLELAEALLARAGTGDADRAAQLLDEVRAFAERSDAPGLVARADALAAHT